MRLVSFVGNFLGLGFLIISFISLFHVCCAITRPSRVLCPMRNFSHGCSVVCPRAGLQTYRTIYNSLTIVFLPIRSQTWTVFSHYLSSTLTHLFSF